MSEPLLEPEFLRRLERLALVARKTLRGVGRGERRSKRHGGTVEFADYRAYTPGDDTRQLDWYAYARLEQLYLKLYVEEQDLALHLLLDRSASMGCGRPPKLDYARQVAVALAYVALAAGDRVTVRPFAGGDGRPAFGPSRGRRALPRLLRYLAEDAAPAGATALDAMARAFLARRPTPGVVVLLSDLLDGGGYEQALRRLRYSGHEVHVLHVVDPEEAEPAVGQDFDFVDAETGEVATVALTQGAVRDYRTAFARFCADAAACCRRHEVGYVLARTDQPFEELLLGGLRERSLLR